MWLVCNKGSHSFSCHPHPNHICLFSPAASITAFWLVLIVLNHEGMTRLSWQTDCHLVHFWLKSIAAVGQFNQEGPQARIARSPHYRWAQLCTGVHDWDVRWEVLSYRCARLRCQIARLRCQMIELTTLIVMLSFSQMLILCRVHDVITDTKLNRTHQSLRHSYKNTVCQTHNRCLTNSLHGTSE